MNNFNFENFKTGIVIICFFPLAWFIRSQFLLHKPKYKWWHFAIIVGGAVLGGVIERTFY